MANVVELKKSRSAYKGYVTRQIKKLTEIFKSEKPESGEIKACIALLEERFAQVKAVDDSLLPLIVADELETFLDETDDYCFTTLKFINYSKDFHTKYFTKPERLPEVKPSALSPKPTISDVKVNLPKIQLPTFGGNQMDWPTFWDSFSAAIDSNKNIKNVQKLTYLRQYLTGDALLCISGLLINDTSYLDAVKLLKDRYAQTHKIVNSLLQSISNLAPPIYGADSLRHFHDKLMCHIRMLEAHGKPVSTLETLLVPQIKEKLPSTLLGNIARTFKEDRLWCLNDILAGILMEVRVLETENPDVGLNVLLVANNRSASSYSRKPLVPNNNNNNYNHKSNSASYNKYSGSNRNTYRNPSTSQSQRKCQLCYGDHLVFHCDKYTTPHLRSQRCRELTLCLNCLGNKHLVKECLVRRNCHQCDRRHHTSLCFAQNSQTNVRSNPNVKTTVAFVASDVPAQNGSAQPTVHQMPSNIPTVEQSPTSNGGALSALLCPNEIPRDTVLLKTAIADVSSSSYLATTNLILDDGSQTSFIVQQLADELHLQPIGFEVVKLSPFGSTSPQLRTLEKVEFFVNCNDGSKVKITALCVPFISTPICMKSRSLAQKIDAFQGLNFAHPLDTEGDFLVSVLIGSDSYYDIIDSDSAIRTDGPVAVNSKIGMLLSGRLPAARSPNISLFNVLIDHQSENQLLESFWKLESIGICHPKECLKTDVDLDNYCDSIQFKSGKYVCKLPWVKNHPPLPTNYNITYQRTLACIKKLQKSGHLEAYCKVMQTQLEKGFIEIVEDAEVTPDTHYLPHSAVFKESSSTPLRVVFDCSCRASRFSPSLNHCLESGPPLLNDIASLLMQFRLNDIGISCDIEKAFLNVVLAEEDRDVTRFLFFKDPMDPTSDLVTYRFKSVFFGGAGSSFMLNASLLKHLRENISKIAAAIEDGIYSDNVLDTVNTPSAAVNFFHESRALLSKGGFNLRSFASSCSELQSIAESQNVADKNPIVKVLGLMWDISKDTLTYQLISHLDTDVITKRLILSFITKLFDPLGYLCPILFNGKLLIQTLWKEKFHWDVPLLQEYCDSWYLISSDLKEGSKLTFRRQFFDECRSSDSFEIHTFADASELGLGAVAYIVKGNQTSILIAKSRIAPVKRITMPKLELVAAVIASRLTNHIKKAFKSCDVQYHLWSDNQAVLTWILTHKVLASYTSDRVKEISELTTSYQWHYVPSEHNPADILTRGKSFKDLQSSSLWWNGPSFLSNVKDWPIWQPQSNVTLVSINSVFNYFPDQEKGNVNSESELGVHKLIDINKYSNLNKLLRVTAYVRRAFRKSNDYSGVISAQELSECQGLWIKSCQEQSYHKEYSLLASKAKSRTPLMKQLDLSMENKLIVSSGRLQNAEISDSSKFPVLLPTYHRLTELFVLKFHREILHAGVGQTVTRIRQMYWIPRIRQLVKKILGKCVTCKKVVGRHYPSPKTPPLIQLRIKEAPAFSVTGVDYTGHFFVRSPFANGELMKVYICLFCCAVTRCIHLEVVQNNTTEAFMLAFRRFCSRRSTPQVMISDNSKTFHSSDDYLKELYKSPELINEINTRGCKWIFNPEKASWYGGFFEILIKLTKQTLKKVLGRTKLRFVEFQTLITEVEASLNDRPLTYVPGGNSIGDPDPITPSQLFQGRKIATCPYPLLEENDLSDPSYIDSSDLQKRMKLRALLFKHFLIRWKTEYLLSLREKHSCKGLLYNLVKVGSVVQIHEDVYPRITWRLGVVVSTVVGADGLIRSVRLKTANGFLNRPITKLYPLEVYASGDLSGLDQPTDNQPVVVKERPPTRAAAVAAMAKISEMT